MSNTYYVYKWLMIIHYKKNCSVQWFKILHIFRTALIIQNVATQKGN